MICAWLVKFFLVIDVGLFCKGVGFVIFFRPYGDPSEGHFFGALGLLDYQDHPMIVGNLSSTPSKGLSYKRCI